MKFHLVILLSILASCTLGQEYGESRKQTPIKYLPPPPPPPPPVNGQPLTIFCASTYDAVCKLEKDPGPCYAYQQKWYYNHYTGTCQTFIYGGCGGNDNRFDSYWACIKKCGRKPHIPGYKPQGPYPYPKPCVKEWGRCLRRQKHSYSSHYFPKYLDCCRGLRCCAPCPKGKHSVSQYPRYGTCRRYCDPCYPVDYDTYKRDSKP